MATTLKEKKVKLHEAVEHGDLEAVKALVNGCNSEDGEQKELINAEDISGHTILHTATEDHTPIVEWILSDSGGRAAGFNGILKTNKYDETCLHFAAANNNLEALIAIVEACRAENGEQAAALLNAIDILGATVLHQAAEKNASKRMIEWILSDSGGRAAGFNRVLAKRRDDETILQSTLWSDNRDAFFAVLEGSKVENGERAELLNPVAKDGWTLLHGALVTNHEAAVQWLLSEQAVDEGFDPNYHLFTLTKEKESVLHVAARGGSIENFELILARCKSNADRLRLFLGIDRRGWTIFYHAARDGKAELIAHILRKYPEESKMIINRRDNRGMTALHRTIIGGNDEKSRVDWNMWQIVRRVESVAALVGLDIKEPSDNDVEDDKEKKVGEKTTITTTAVKGGADPNVGLRFD